MKEAALQDEIEFSSDFVIHNPVAIRVERSGAPLDLGSLGRWESRHITPTGLLLEIHPPLEDLSIFQLRDPMEVFFQLAGYNDPFKISGTVTRIVRLAKESPESCFSLLAIRFLSLDANQKQILEAHRLEAQAARGQPRAERVRVRFPVETVGIEVASSFMAYDLSMSGMYIGTEAKIRQGRILNFSCHFPFQPEPAQSKGKIIWVGQKLIRGHEIVLPGFGIQFMEISDKARSNLARYYSQFVITP